MALDMTPGLVALPGHTAIPFDQGAGRKVENVGMNRLGPRIRNGLAYHRAQGWGSVGWLLNPSVRGLTDWVISEKADATMTQINYITGTNRDLAGWAQGPYGGANGDPSVCSADGRAFRAKYARAGVGASIINLDLDSIEIMGFYDDPVHDNCKRDVAQWTAHHAHNDGIPWSQFPIRNNGLTYIYGHREFCGTDFKLCPGSVVWTFINGELIDRVQGILRKAQEGTVTPPNPVYVKPRIPAVMTKNPLPETTTLNGKEMTLVNASYRADKPTPCFISASRTASKTRTDMYVGEDTTIVYTFTSGGELWGLSRYGSRIPMKDMAKIIKSEEA